MAEEVGGSKNGSFQNHASSSSDQRRRASKGAERTWASLQQTKTPRGNPSAGASARWLSSSEAKSIAGGQAVLFVRVQQRNWILLPHMTTTVPKHKIWPL